MESKISIIICTRNRPDYLKQCLLSLEESSLEPDAVIVIDQSDDNRTMMLVDEKKTVSPIKLQYINLDTKGLAKARNIGIKAARSEIVAFTDDDCTVTPGWIEAILEEFDDETVCCVCGKTVPANHINRDKAAMISTVSGKKKIKLTTRWNPIIFGRGNNMAFNRNDLLKLGGFNEDMGVGAGLQAGEDTDVFYRIMEVGKTVTYTPQAIVFHAQPDDWKSVVAKKHIYAESVSALLCSRLRYGDTYAGALLAGKILYELSWLTCCAAIRAKRNVADVGWNSLKGSVKGIKYLFDEQFCQNIRSRTMFAQESYSLEEKEFTPAH